MKVTQKIWTARLLAQNAKNRLPRGFKMAEMKVITYVDPKAV